MSRKRFIFSATLIVLMAAILRLHALTDIPPGLHFDEAANGVIVRSIAFEGYRPLFIPSFTGKETLWFYLAAPLMRLTGPVTFSLRLTSAFLGILTVAATGWLVRRLYPDDPRRDTLALLAMAVLGVAFWHGVLSRLAFRAISQPLMQALSLGLLWQGLRASRIRRRTGWLALAGIATGLTAYTYLAARLFPIPLAAAWLTLLLSDRERLQRLRDLGVYGAGAALTFAPLGALFLRQPELFGTRIAQVAPRTPAEALAGWRAAPGMFFLSGDPLWRFNLPGRPLFGPVLALFFLIGLAEVVIGAIRTRDPLRRARGALLIVWLPAMLAPTALATQAITPSNLRAVGLAPLIALYPALGIAALAGWLRQRGGATLRRAGEIAAPAALALLVLLGGPLTLRDTLRWGHEPTLYYDNDGHVAAIAEYLNGQDAAGSGLYVATFHFQHPTLAFLAEDYPRIHSLFGGDALVLSPEGETLAIYARDALPPEEWRGWLSSYQVAAPPGPDGTPDFYAYRLPEEIALPLPSRADHNFASLIVLEGGELSPALSGTEATVDLGWRVLAGADQPDYALIAEVCDMWGWCWLRANLDGTLERGLNATYPSTQWTPGERLLTRLRVPLPQGMPPGEYTVRISVYSATGDERLPLVDAAGGFAGLYAELAPLEIRRNTGPDLSGLPIQYRLDQPLDGALRLLGYDYPVQTARPGEQLHLALYWLSEGTRREDIPVRLALDDGTILYQGQPVHGTYPASEWQAGELVVDRYAIRVPHDLPSGEYTLSLQPGDDPPIALGPLRVEATTHRFEVPAGITLLEPPVTLGGQIGLLGYELPEASVRPGERLSVGLVWRSETEVATGYTVFVHLVDASGTIVAQQDRPPQADGAPYPTDLWLPGEVVVDEYTLAIPLDAPAGEYSLRVGLYLPESGQRLSVPGTADNAVTLPPVITIR